MICLGVLSHSVSWPAAREAEQSNDAALHRSKLAVGPAPGDEQAISAESWAGTEGAPVSEAEKQLNALMDRFRLLQEEEWDLARTHWSQLSKEEQGRFLARVQHQAGIAMAEGMTREEAEQYVDKARSRASAEQWEQIIADPRLLTPDEQRSFIDGRDEVIQEVVGLGEPAVPLLIQRAAFLAREVRGHPQLRTGWGEQRYAEMALGRMGGVAVPYLLKAVKSEEALTRESAARALGPIQDERAVEPLIRLLSDTSGPVRYAAAQALTEIGDARATEPLVKALGDEYHMVRWWAVRGLEKFGDSSCIAPLEELARTNPGKGKGDLRPHVSQAIEAIRSREQAAKESEVE